MPEERDERPEHADRVDRIVRDLLAGRRLAVGPEDGPNRDAILAAARLAGAREPYARMSPAFRRRLQARLDGDRGVLSRRTALIAGLGAAAGAVAGVAAIRIGDVARPAPARRTAFAPSAAGVIDPRPGRWYDAGPMSSFMEGRPVRFQAGAVGAFLVREGDAVIGLSSICTHLPCELVWKGTQQQLLCPCHNLSFDTGGNSITDGGGYPLAPLPRLQVKVVGGRVQVLGT